MDLYFGISASRRAPPLTLSGDAPAVWDGTSEMWAALYVFTVCFVALTLFAAVHELENRLLAAALKFFIIAVAVAAIASARRLLP